MQMLFAPNTNDSEKIHANVRHRRREALRERTLKLEIRISAVTVARHFRIDLSNSQPMIYIHFSILFSK